jgi:hypothetical protein
LDSTDIDSVTFDPAEFIVQDEKCVIEGEVKTAPKKAPPIPVRPGVCQFHAPPPIPPRYPAEESVHIEVKEREVKTEVPFAERENGDVPCFPPPSDPVMIDPFDARIKALMVDIPDPAPQSDPKDEDCFEHRFAELMKDIPSPPDNTIPIAPPIENLPAMEAELAALILKKKLSSGLHQDEKKVDPPIHLEALPNQFKVRRDVPWFTKMLHKYFGCCNVQLATTRHYSLEGLQLADFHINGLDVRATNALSHTMLRQEPQIIRISVVPYDQFDNVMPVFDRDPVTWAQGYDVGRSVIHIPLVLIADMMRKFMCTDATVGDMRMLYQDLVKVINVPYNEFMSSEPDFVMFGLDLMKWLKQRRQNEGLLNFHPNQSI